MKPKKIPLRQLLWIGAALFSALSASPAQAQAVKVLRVNGKAGIGQIKPGHWGMLAVDVVNSSDKSVQARASLHFQGHDQHRYVRQIWIPAKSLRRAWVPVRMPLGVTKKRPFVEVRTYLYVVGSRAVSRSHDEIYHTFRVPIEREKHLTVLVADEPEDERDELHKIVVKARKSAKLSARVARFTNLELPPLTEGLDSADQIILANDKIRHDAAGRRSLRQWVLGGGRLWIMMGLVKPDTVRLLLGDTFSSYVVDETKLRELKILDTDPNAEDTDLETRTRQFDEPVSFTRILPEGLEVSHKIGEWPSAVWAKMGRGEVLITTLEPRGWVELTSRFRTELARKQDMGQTRASPSLRKISRRFFQPREPSLLGEEIMELFEEKDASSTEPPSEEAEPPAEISPLSKEILRYLQSQIGYEIASKTQVGLVLIGFCGVLAVSGFYLGTRQQLGKIGIIAPVAALAGTVLLLIIGQQSRSKVEPTVATLQIIHAQSGGEQLEVSGLMALYQDDKADLGSKSTSGGTFQIDMSQLGKDGQFVWTSINQWEWENLNLPHGVRFAPFRGQVVPTDPVTATVSFDEQGITGELRTGALKVDNDLLVVYSRTTPRLGVKFNQGKLSGGVGDILPTDGWILDSPMTQEQQRRNALLATAFNSSKTFPSRPTLAVWCKPTDVGFDFPNLKQRRGASLLLVPIEFRRPEPGTKVAIPSAFLSYGTTIGPDGISRSSIYSSSTGKWVPVEEQRQAWLRIQLPKSLLPLKVSQVDVVMNVTAPQRNLSILGTNSSGVSELKKISSPNGSAKYELKQQEYLQLDKKGDLLIAVKIDRAAGDTGVNAKVKPAMIESVQFVVHGEIPPKSVPDSKQAKKKKS